MRIIVSMVLPKFVTVGRLQMDGIRDRTSRLQLTGHLRENRQQRLPATFGPPESRTPTRRRYPATTSFDRAEQQRARHLLVRFSWTAILDASSWMLSTTSTSSSSRGGVRPRCMSTCEGHSHSRLDGRQQPPLRPAVWTVNLADSPVPVTNGIRGKYFQKIEAEALEMYCTERTKRPNTVQNVFNCMNLV